MPLCCVLSWNEQCAEAAAAVCPASRSLHVVSADNVQSGTRLDGFVIRDGWGGGQPEYDNPYDDSGAGLLVYNSSNPVIANCTFEDNIANQGGAIAVTNNCAPLIVNCRIAGNRALIGGAAYSLQGSPTFVNCFILSNTAEGGAGGAVYATGAATKLINCLLLDNLASGYGSAIYQVATLRNCIVWSSGGTPIAGAAEVITSCVEGGYPGEGIVESWPGFADPLDGNFRLLAGSPCIDAGSGPLPQDLGDLDADLDCAETTPRDLGGGARWLGKAIDIGPYEHCAYDLDSDGAVGVADMLGLLGSWGAAGSPADLDRDGVVDVSDLLALFQNWYECG
jgi:parallel beta-helix repeat protein